MNKQEAKADMGKPRPTLVRPETIRALAVLEEYDQDALRNIRAKMIRKTQKVNGSWHALFECSFCGNEFEANMSNVLRGKQRSCGCAKGKLSVASKGTHGETRTRLYRIWHHILERCNSPSCKQYKWYGARGIECEFKSFEDFRDYAYETGYRDDLTCERIDVNKNYAPGNITWIPQQWQPRNMRSNVKITYKGLTLCAGEWAEILGVNADTLTKRKRNGWTDDRTIETRVGNSVDISLVPVEVIHAIRETRLYGIKKYGSPDNWKDVEPQRYRDALCRHLLAYLDDPKSKDEESGMLHSWHAACNLAFLIEMESKP